MQTQARRTRQQVPRKDTDARVVNHRPHVKPKPEWIKTALGSSDDTRVLRSLLRGGGLNTVCVEARCPNKGECFGENTATFMILGRICTRGCAFCNVERGGEGAPLDRDEPARVAHAVEKMGLDYAVITSVTRDDLDDGGAAHFADTVSQVRALAHRPKVEVLIPDYHGTALRRVVESGPRVLAHNIEVVKRLSPSIRHRRFSYRASLETLRQARALADEATADRKGGPVVTKSSLMLGLGERDDEVEEAFADLLVQGVEILALGQYLQPSRRHAPVVEYVEPARFEEWAVKGRDMGFRAVWAGPLVRTSYRAAQAYEAAAAKVPRSSTAKG